MLQANRVEDLPAGLYHYDAPEHRLLPLAAEKGFGSRIREACLNQPILDDCAAVFHWIAVADRMTWRYGERGYRYLFLDAGHVCQNLYLAAESLGAGACAVGAFDDEALDRALGLAEDEFTVYLAVVGKRR